jgi:capsule polysaccharide modification protein KpsS
MLYKNQGLEAHTEPSAQSHGPLAITVTGLTPASMVQLRWTHCIKKGSKFSVKITRYLLAHDICFFAKLFQISAKLSHFFKASICKRALLM